MVTNDANSGNDANSLGQEELITFVRERVMAPREDGCHKKLRDPLCLKMRLPQFEILSLELVAVFLAISDASSQLCTGNKLVMMELLSSGMERPRVMPIAGKSTLIVDGQALVMVLGRPSDCNTFDDLGDKFVKAALASGKDFDRTDMTFGN